jgi:predicted alpha/beta-hydrolase family hydrolase
MRIKETRLFFTSKGEEAIRLEGVFHHPGGRNHPAAVICHPHSLYGGSMDVSLVVSIARTLVERGIIALRFNFRGVGRSKPPPSKLGGIPSGMILLGAAAPKPPLAIPPPSKLGGILATLVKGSLARGWES